MGVRIIKYSEKILIEYDHKKKVVKVKDIAKHRYKDNDIVCKSDFDRLIEEYVCYDLLKLKWRYHSERSKE